VIGLLAAFVTTAVSQCYALQIERVDVGWACVRLDGLEGSKVLTYGSESIVHRGPATVRLTTEATAALDSDLGTTHLVASRREGSLRVGSVDEKGLPVPSSLAWALIDDRHPCVSAVEETTGRRGQICGRREGREVKGNWLGTPFVAERGEGLLPRLLLFPAQGARFTAVATAPRIDIPPDLFADPLPVEGSVPSGSIAFVVPVADLPTGAGQFVKRSAGEVEVRWSPTAPAIDSPRGATQKPSNGDGDLAKAAARLADGRSAWSATLELSRAVRDRITDLRPAANESDAEEIYTSRRASCRGHVSLFLDLARLAGIEAREVVGLVFSGGDLYPHRWAEVRVGKDWFPVDPTEGHAIPITPRIALGAGDAAGQTLLHLRSSEKTIRVVAASTAPH
jgi:hypothetical protein